MQHEAPLPNKLAIAQRETDCQPRQLPIDRGTERTEKALIGSNIAFKCVVLAVAVS